MPNSRDLFSQELSQTKAELTQLQTKFDQLAQSHAMYRLLLDESSDPIFAFYPDGTYRYVNHAFAGPFGKTPDQIIGKKIWDIFSQEEADLRYRALKSVFETGQTKVIEVRVPTATHDQYYITTIKPILDGNKNVTAVICISKDITERKRIEEENKFLSTHDVLTGAYNRNYFEMELMRLQDDPAYPIAIIMADVDNLKEINNRYGHIIGDDVLRKAGRVLQQSFRINDLVARIGGDEFAIILPSTDFDSATESVERIEQILHSLHEPLLNLSVGFDVAGPNQSIAQALKSADVKMYAMKERRKNTPLESSTTSEI